MDDDDDNSLSNAGNFVAGGLANTIGEVMTLPIKTVSTRLKADNALHGRSILATTRAVVSEEGFRGLFAGVGATVAMAAPGSAIYFCVYEVLWSCLLVFGVFYR
jgi:hypothetical protein